MPFALFPACATTHSVVVAAVVIATVAGAHAAPRLRLRHDAGSAGTADARPLTIGRRGGIYRQGDDIIAPGGFASHGYGYPQATAEDRRAAYNARIRANASGLYGAGTDGIGGWGFDDDPETGYTNPYYGNSFNRYVGFNGVPSSLAFGPAFANRRMANHDPVDDDLGPGPSPEDLGYSPDR